MFELYQNMNSSRGTLAEVWLDRDARLVKKYYKPDAITIRGGSPITRDPIEIERLFRNEIYWSERLRSEFVLQIYEHGELPGGQGFYILQEYVGPDLLHYYRSTGLDSSVIRPTDRIIEIFKFFKEMNVYKLNNAMCNMVNDGGKIKVFDFKYAVPRSPEHKQGEIDGINQWISKIDPRLPNLLLEHV